MVSEEEEGHLLGIVAMCVQGCILQFWAAHLGQANSIYIHLHLSVVCSAVIYTCINCTA